MHSLDITAYKPNASEADALAFKSEFFSDFLPTQEIYEYPYFNLNEEVQFGTSSFDEMWEYVFQGLRRKYLFWLRSRNHDEILMGQIRVYPEQDMCFSLAVSENLEGKYFDILEKKFGVKSVFVSHGNAIPGSAKEAREVVMYQ